LSSCRQLYPVSVCPRRLPPWILLQACMA
jgi:hypothetical protein